MMHSIADGIKDMATLQERERVTLEHVRTTQDCELDKAQQQLQALEQMRLHMEQQTRIIEGRLNDLSTAHDKMLSEHTFWGKQTREIFDMYKDLYRMQQGMQHALTLGAVQATPLHSLRSAASPLPAMRSATSPRPLQTLSVPVSVQ
jgi:hypothetical protein